MAYWYYWNDDLPRNSASYNSFSSPSLPNIIPYDFILDGVVYNIDNITNTGFSKYDGTVAGGSYTRIYYLNLDGTPSVSLIKYNGVMCGRVSIVRTKTKPTSHSSTFTELSTGNISGKYRLKQIITTAIPNNLRVGTIPVKFAINGINYNYLCFDDLRSQYTNWTGRFRSNSYSFAGYINPIDMSRTAEGDAEDYTRFISSSNVIKTEFQNKIIDFGDTPQEVPQIFINWINANFDYVYPYKYTVKSPDGLILAEQDELPPIRSIKLSSVGNNVDMVLTGSNGVDYTLTWTHTVPEGKIFLGLGYSESDKRVSIPTGTTTSVTWDSSITVYEIYGTYRPPETTFDINLYQNTAEGNRVDKTNYLTQVGTISGALRSSTSINDLVITYESKSIPNFNYVYIPIFNRYYFVDDITSENYSLWTLALSVDPLMTYKEAIINCNGFVDRCESDFNANIIDKKRVVEEGNTIEVDTVTNELFTNNTGTYIMTALLISFDTIE